MRITRRLTTLVLSFLVAATAAIAAPAAKRTEIKLDHPVLVGNTLVPAGTYRLEISPELDGVRLFKGNDPVVAAPARVDVARVVYPGTALHTRPQADGRDKLVKIVLSDAKLAIDLDPAASSVAEAPATRPSESR